MNKTPLSMMILDDHPENAMAAVYNAVSSIAQDPQSVSYSPPWTIRLGDEREIEINLDEKLMKSLSSLPRAKEFLFDSGKRDQCDLILVDMQWDNTGSQKSTEHAPSESGLDLIESGLELVESLAASQVTHPFLALYTQWPISASWIYRALSARTKGIIQKQETVHLLNLLVSAAEQTRLKRIVDAVRGGFEKVDARLQSNSPAMQECLSEAASYALNPTLHILLTGPTGSGKGVLAKGIHQASSRARRPFERVDCASLTNPDLAKSELFGHEKGAYTGAVAARQGIFELASGGTVFLDEVHTLPREIHAMLHNVIQDGEFRRLGGERMLKTDVRVISATTEDPGTLLSSGTLARDFLSRIAYCRVSVPGLNRRREDIPDLAKFFLESFRARMGRPLASFSPGAMRSLLAYSWPENIRELRSVIERSFTRSGHDELEASDLIFGYDETGREAPQSLSQAAIGRLLRARPREGNQQKIFDRLVAQYPAFVPYRDLHEDIGLSEVQPDKADPLLTTKMGQLRSRLRDFGFTIENEERQGYHLRMLESDEESIKPVYI